MSWKVPMLSARQNRLIDPLMIRLLPLFTQKAEKGVPSLSNEDYESLQEIIFQAISKASPDLTREQFLELPVTLAEMMTALPIIAEQTGLFAKHSGEQGGSAGEP